MKLINLHSWLFNLVDNFTFYKGGGGGGSGNTGNIAFSGTTIEIAPGASETLINISPNGDFGVLDFPELRPLINEIDFNQWIFDGEYRCIYDVAKDNNNFQADGFHPESQTQRYWAKLIFDQIQG